MTPQELAVTRDKNGLCVICEKQEDERKRGLCGFHYGRFRAALLQLSKDERPDFDEMVTSQGKILPSRQGKRESEEEDPFPDALAEFHRQSINKSRRQKSNNPKDTPSRAKPQQDFSDKPKRG